jgi:16S rRNA (adenine1518-N6/adenine1519-N6)-dimethyltransferase
VHAFGVTVGEARLLGPVEVRALAAELDLRPTKRLGQNFVHDANTVRRIVRAAELTPDDVVLEVGPGLGSLTLALLPEVAAVQAVEIDPVLAARLPATVAERAPALAERLTVHTADALRLRACDIAVDRAVAWAADGAGARGPDPRAADAGGDRALGGGDPARDDRRLGAEPAKSGRILHQPGDHSGDRAQLPTALVANLPYNVAVPVVLHLLAELPGIRRGLVMVQAEVAERLAAAPGSRAYGVPSAKLAWYAAARRAGPVPRSVFWPVPGVDSGLLAFDRHDPPPGDRATVFAVVDAAFAQRRKALRSALAGWAGSPPAAEAVLRGAEVDPRARAETLTIADFARIAAAR